ncbi:MAG: type II toxin-antitoxin system Y4mF family antitoxin [bacterium]
MDTLGHDVRERRRQLGLRQQDLADLSATSPRFIRELEGGKTTVRLDKLAAVLEALGLDLRTVRREPGASPAAGT